MRGENCMEASVSVISRIAKTMETTVMMEAAMPPRMNCATCGSEWEGKSALGTMSLTTGKVSSSHERSAPAQPSAKRDGQRAHQEAATQVVHGLAQQQSQSLVHHP